MKIPMMGEYTFKFIEKHFTNSTIWSIYPIFFIFHPNIINRQWI